MQKEIVIDLSSFTKMELANIEQAALSMGMSMQQYVVFLMSGVATPKAKPAP